MKKLKKILKITGIAFVSLLALMIAIPFLFPQAVNRKISGWANQNINGHIAFSHTRLSFFKHFPNLTLSLYDVTLMGSAPFQKDTLIAAEDIALGIDVPSIFKSKITINKIYLKGAFINIHVDSAGNANYNIYKPSASDTTASTDTSGGGASMGINKIQVENSRLVYDDESLPMVINARGFSYLGSGDLSKDVFALNSHTEIESLDFSYAKQPYVIGKKINADLVTQINTKSLSFVFEKNNLLINQLPVDFDGHFSFIPNGYDMDFNIDSHESDIEVIVSALPADMQKMLEKTGFDGTGNISIKLAGKFVVKDSLAPDLSMSLKIRNGAIANDKTPSPVKNLYLDFTAKMPKLNPDSLAVNVDSLYFNIADGYMSSVMRVKGLKEPEIYARVNAEMDLDKWDNAIGLKPFHVKGLYSLHLLAEGRYATGVEKKGKKTDTVITSIPKFTLYSTFKNGYFKYTSMPEAISNIGFNMDASCADNDYKHITLAIDNLDVSALKSYIKGSFKLRNLADYDVDALLHANIHLDDLKKIYPIDSMDLRGDLLADIKAKGSYLPGKKKYPEVAATLTMTDGYIQTKYYPHPIEHIQVNTKINDKTGDLKGLNITVQPITFSFENKPFLLKADLKNFNDLAYSINIKGTLDIGKIYQVFAVKGYNVTGSIAANLTMKGKQSDATAGHYDKLFNKGSLTINDITCTTDLYPKPFYITKGVFSFNQDKMRLDTFTAKYANSVFVVSGSVSNVIDYIMKPGSVLTGNVDLKSDQLVVDNFMAADAPAPTAATPTPASGTPSGVVAVPRNLNLTLDADIKKVKYNDIVLTDAKGHMTVNNGTITLKETGFTIIGAPVTMDADYTSVNTKKATFNYHISAKNFDVHKAYTSIRIFHDLATSASSAEGLISLDYKLGGNLKSGMVPVYPSLKGGGVITAERIKMKGFKLFGAIGKETGKDSLGGNSDVSRVKIKSTIANNIITIEPTKMRVSVFRAKFGGQVSFNNELNLKFRLGLPPLGLIGIPMTITGTEDKPNIHMGKGKEADELKETADTEDE